jgi:hypothetical protein
MLTDSLSSKESIVLIVNSVITSSYASGPLKAAGKLQLDPMKRSRTKILRAKLSANASKIISSGKYSWVDEAGRRGELEVLLESKLGHCRRSFTILAHTISRMNSNHT